MSHLSEIPTYLPTYLPCYVIGTVEILVLMQRRFNNNMPGTNTMYLRFSVTSKKLPNVYKSCLKMISLVKLKILTPLQKLPKNARDLGKLIVSKGFEKLPKVQ